MADWKHKEASIEADPSEELPPYSIEDNSWSIAVASSGPSGASTESQDLAGAESSPDQSGPPSTAPLPPPSSRPPTGPPPAVGSIIESKAKLAAAEAARNREASSASAAVPTAASPFNFPSDADLPPYSPAEDPGSSASPSTTNQQLPIMIPQVRPVADSPFLSAYSPDLLRYGIPSDTWLSFVDTLSAFLTANVSAQAISHAADIGRQLGGVPSDLGRSIADSARHVGRDLRRSAKRGNVLGFATGIVSGALSLSVGTSLKLAASATALPSRAAMAVMSRPQTPRERAAAYALVANGKWLGQRGLKAQVLDSTQVCDLLGVSMESLLLDRQAAGEAAEAQKVDDDGAPDQKKPLAHLQGAAAEIETTCGAPESAAQSPTTPTKLKKANSAASPRIESSTLEELGQSTIWLVVTREKDKGPGEHDADQSGSSDDASDASGGLGGLGAKGKLGGGPCR